MTIKALSSDEVVSRVRDLAARASAVQQRLDGMLAGASISGADRLRGIGLGPVDGAGASADTWFSVETGHVTNQLSGVTTGTYTPT